MFLPPLLSRCFTRPDVLAELLLLVRLEGVCQDIKMIVEALQQRRCDTSCHPPSTHPSINPSLPHPHHY